MVADLAGGALVTEGGTSGLNNVIGSAMVVGLATSKDDVGTRGLVATDDLHAGDDGDDEKSKRSGAGLDWTTTEDRPPLPEVIDCLIMCMAAAK